MRRKRQSCRSKHKGTDIGRERIWRTRSPPAPPRSMISEKLVPCCSQLADELLVFPRAPPLCLLVVCPWFCAIARARHMSCRRALHMRKLHACSDSITGVQAYLAKPHLHTKHSILYLILVQPSSAAVERMFSILQNSFTHIYIYQQQSSLEK